MRWMRTLKSRMSFLLSADVIALEWEYARNVPEKRTERFPLSVLWLANGAPQQQEIPPGGPLLDLPGGIFALSISLHWHPIHCVLLRHFLRQFYIGIYGDIWRFVIFGKRKPRFSGIYRILWRNMEIHKTGWSYDTELHACSFENAYMTVSGFYWCVRE